MKVTKDVSAIKNLRCSLPQKSLATIYNAFLLHLIGYGDIVYDQRQNAALAVTGIIHGTSREKMYQELGLESLKSRRWYRRLSCIFKIMKMEAPTYLMKLIPKSKQTIRTRNNHIPSYSFRTYCFKYSFSSLP